MRPTTYWLEQFTHNTHTHTHDTYTTHTHTTHTTHTHTTHPHHTHNTHTHTHQKASVMIKFIQQHPPNSAAD